MAQQAYYQQQMAMAQKGPLQAGQTIKLSQHTVTVERYLSQGGFAHVYLVRTATPVMGTTQHVLKRMAVADVATLAEVKKEVDIMRLLRGHPNIVHLLDSASRPLPNGQHEVYILMEFCQGGGIIDMMNRRLRERLTEKDILQIFVDVCEAVACMHSLQPALLHRDLKVENILQATETSFKLCDFGSAAPSRPKPPSTMEEIKLLEADLNRSTTLQYRAPEMVDVYLRRPIDEKSDVWALGVLLYKLCYYTTPFEAHGPLAILHVQYSIPGYPVYSKEMNALIGCMLRELGVQRPSVFEVLSVVHRMRGTKSQFNYARPQQIPPSPSIQPAQLQDSLIQTSAQRAQAQAQSQREKQLREQKEALDAMNMRRGRPNENHSQQQQVPPSAPPTTLSKAPALPSRQPLAPLTRSRPSKSGGSRDSEKGARAKQQQQQGSDSPRKGAATPITTTTLAPSSPRKSTAPLASPRKSTATTTSTPSRVQGAPASPRKSSATPVKAPVGGVRVGPSSVGVRPSGTGAGAGTNGVKGLNTGGAKVPTKSPTTDFFNDPSWKHSSTSDEKEKDIWGGETVSSPATATATPTTTTTATNKFDGFADSFDGINGSGTGSAGRSSGSKLAGVGGVALPGLHKPSSTSHHHPTSTSGAHHPTSHSHHHQPTIQQPKTTRTATRDAFEGLGIPSAPSPALSLRELAARSPVPSPGVGVGHGGSAGMGHGGSLSPMPGLSGSPMPSSLSPTPGAGVLGQSPTPFSRSPHPLTTGATASTGVTGTLTTQATAGSATSGSKGALALSAEERFPSIEELDAGTWQDKTKDREPSVPKLPPRPKPTREDSKPSVPTTTTRPGAVTQRSHLTGPNSHGLRPPVQGSGSRSQQVTGTAMKDPERVGATTTGTGAGTNGTTTPKVSRALPVPPATTTNTGPASTTGLGLLRRPSNGGAGPGVRRVSSIGSKNREESSPSPTRRAAGSPSKPPTSPAKPRPSSVIQTSSGKPAIAPKPALTPKPGGRAQSQTTRPDWLTGDFLETAAAMGISVPESPTKRSSALLGTATGGGGGGAGTRYQAPLKSPAGENLGRSTPDPLGRATPNRLRAATSMTESSNDEGPEDPVAPYGRAKLERRGALTRSSPERKSRSSTLDVPISTGNTPTSSPAHRRGPSENLIDLGSNNVKSSRPVRTPSTASSNASHPPTSGPRSRRPQSMFIQAGTPISAALTPPVDPNAATKRSVRRGSISDMVSRYEALASPTVENQTTGSGGVQRRPSITPKPAGLRVPSTKVPPPERRRSPSPVATRPRSPVAARPRSPERIEREIPITRDVPITTPTTASTSVFNRENRTRTSPTEMMRDVPIQDGNARAPSPAGRRSRPPSPIKMTHPVVQPTPSRTSRAPLHTITPPHAKEEPQATRAPSPPPSPDKPYQGVGRLIDQWQKKAGAEPGRPLGPRVGRR